MNTLLFIGHPKEENLALFAGGELGPLARWRIEQHLEKCPACQDVVADFFHLHSNVSELAELPPIDWNEFAQDIEARVRLETPDVENAKGGWLAHHPWQVGLATAALLCTIVVVRQFPSVSQGLMEESPLALNAPSAKSKDFGDAALFDRLEQAAPQASPAEPEQRAASAPGQMAQSADAGAIEESRARPSDQARDSSAGNELAYAGPARREALQPVTAGALAPDTEAAPPPAEQKVANALLRQSLSDEAAASRSRGAERFEPLGDVKRAPEAPAPPVAAAAQKEREADAAQDLRADVRAKQETPAVFGGAAGASAKSERLAVSRPQGAVAALGALRGQQQGLMKKADADGALIPQRGFTVLPAALEDPNVDVGVAADGWISVRSVDGNTGTITITDVYVP